MEVMQQQKWRTTYSQTCCIKALLLHTKNAGTSVEELERFYLARMAPTPEMIENLHTDGTTRPASRKHKTTPSRRLNVDHMYDP